MKIMYHKNFPEKNLKQWRNSHEKNPLLCNFEVCIQGDVIGHGQLRFVYDKFLDLPFEIFTMYESKIDKSVCNVIIYVLKE